uniref:Protein kinase domain-containing protein n=1 Tax=Nelumbo nucifera TaxID=4432 RepID=A0A822YTH6_NELNU|nr:TPA_asm: hypothetical protein HUJ06_006053 [Nelumbo nucifera]
MLGARGTVGYIAPEVFSRHFGKVSHKSDVYSYGMMVLEMVGGRKKIDLRERLTVDRDLGLDEDTSEGEDEIVRKMSMVGLCKVVAMLEGSLESMQVPPKPFLTSPSRSPHDSLAE